MFRCPVGTFSKDQTLAFFKYCENNRKISLSPQEPGTCTYRNTFLTGAPLAMVTVGPGWLAGVGEVQRYKVTSQHQPQPTPPPLPGSARARATRTNTAHHTPQHTVHYTQHRTHGHTVLAPGPLSPLRVLPARPAAAAAQWWCAGRDLETRNQSGGWRWLASNTAAAQQRGGQRRK